MSWLRVQGLWFRVQGLGFKGPGFRGEQWGLERAGAGSTQQASEQRSVTSSSAW